MYCRNCGTHLDDEDVFCPECGNKIKIIKKEPLINYKNFTQKQKNIFKALISLAVIILVYMTLDNAFFSEEAVIKRYVKAYANSNYNTVINLSKIEKNKFITSSNIKRKYGKETFNIIEIKKITSSTVKNEHTRTVLYTLNNNDITMNLTIKKTGRKLIIFNDYKITSTDLVANNLKITVPNDAQLMVDGVKLTTKDQTKTKDKLTTYKIDSLLKKDVEIKLTLKNGLTLTENKSVFNNEEINYTKLNYSEISGNAQNKLNKILKDNINNIIKNAIIKKDFSEAIDSSLYTDEFKNSEVLKSSYENLVKKYSDKTVTDFNLEKMSINNVEIDDDNNIIINTTITYSYKDENKKAHEKSRVVDQTITNDLLLKELNLTTLSYMF